VSRIETGLRSDGHGVSSPLVVMSQPISQLSNMPPTAPRIADPPEKYQPLLRRLAGCLAVSCALLAVLYVFRAPLLVGLAEVWVVNNPAPKADAIVILGGGLENRPFAAAKLFCDGAAPRILYMDVKLSPAEEIGIILPEREQTHRILLRNGVPETAMTAIGTNVASTYDESKAVEAWMAKTGAKSIIIPTDIFHTRRVRWLFNKELRAIKPDIHVVATNPRRYNVQNWWRQEEGVIAFQNELIKYAYYRLKY
jgi:uncharacterized SAM-binding protein YcdF (DUF218 family)